MKAGRGNWLTGEARSALRRRAVELYDEGYSIRQICTMAGSGYGTVHQLLVEAKVPLRGRGDPMRKRINAARRRRSP